MFFLFLFSFFFFFFFNDTATTEIYTTRHTLSLHDALPISFHACSARNSETGFGRSGRRGRGQSSRSEEYTSELQSRLVISYAVFCLKKKKTKNNKQKRTPYINIQKYQHQAQKT